PTGRSSCAQFNQCTLPPSSLLWSREHDGQGLRWTVGAPSLRGRTDFMTGPCAASLAKPCTNTPVRFDWWQKFSAVAAFAMDHHRGVLGHGLKDARLDWFFLGHGVCPILLSP